MNACRSSRLISCAALLFAVHCDFATAAEGSPRLVGPLFQTQEERAQLDRARAGLPEVAPTAARSVSPPVINGFVKRSDGRATVWVDGVAAKTDNAVAMEKLEPMMVGGSLAGSKGSDAPQVEGQRLGHTKKKTVTASRPKHLKKKKPRMQIGK
jgi:hypothetical protein